MFMYHSTVGKQIYDMVSEYLIDWVKEITEIFFKNKSGLILRSVYYMDPWRWKNAHMLQFLLTIQKICLKIKEDNMMNTFKINIKKRFK